MRLIRSCMLQNVKHKKMWKYIRTYERTYIRTYVHTYIQSYIHTYIHTTYKMNNTHCTYIHTYVRTHAHALTKDRARPVPVSPHHARRWRRGSREMQQASTTQICIANVSEVLSSSTTPLARTGCCQPRPTAPPTSPPLVHWTACALCQTRQSCHSTRHDGSMVMVVSHHITSHHITASRSSTCLTPAVGR